MPMKSDGSLCKLINKIDSNRKMSNFCLWKKWFDNPDITSPVLVVSPDYVVFEFFHLCNENPEITKYFFSKDFELSESHILSSTLKTVSSSLGAKSYHVYIGNHPSLDSQLSMLNNSRDQNYQISFDQITVTLNEVEYRPKPMVIMDISTLESEEDPVPYPLRDRFQVIYLDWNSFFEGLYIENPINVTFLHKDLERHSKSDSELTESEFETRYHEPRSIHHRFDEFIELPTDDLIKSFNEEDTRCLIAKSWGFNGSKKRIVIRTRSDFGSYRKLVSIKNSFVYEVTHVDNSEGFLEYLEKEVKDHHENIIICSNKFCKIMDQNIKLVLSRLSRSSIRGVYIIYFNNVIPQNSCFWPVFYFDDVLYHGKEYSPTPYQLYRNDFKGKDIEYIMKQKCEMFFERYFVLSKDYVFESGQNPPLSYIIDNQDNRSFLEEHYQSRNNIQNNFSFMKNLSYCLHDLYFSDIKQIIYVYLLIFRSIQDKKLKEKSFFANFSDSGFSTLFSLINESSTIFMMHCNVNIHPFRINNIKPFGSISYVIHNEIMNGQYLPKNHLINHLSTEFLRIIERSDTNSLNIIKAMFGDGLSFYAFPDDSYYHDLNSCFIIPGLSFSSLRNKIIQSYKGRPNIITDLIRMYESKSIILQPPNIYELTHYDPIEESIRASLYKDSIFHPWDDIPYDVYKKEHLEIIKQILSKSPPDYFVEMIEMYRLQSFSCYLLAILLYCTTWHDTDDRSPYPSLSSIMGEEYTIKENINFLLPRDKSLAYILNMYSEHFIKTYNRIIKTIYNPEETPKIPFFLYNSSISVLRCDFLQYLNKTKDGTYVNFMKKSIPELFYIESPIIEIVDWTSDEVLKYLKTNHDSIFETPDEKDLIEIQRRVPRKQVTIDCTGFNDYELTDIFSQCNGASYSNTEFVEDEENPRGNMFSFILLLMIELGLINDCEEEINFGIEVVAIDSLSIPSTETLYKIDGSLIGRLLKYIPSNSQIRNIFK